MPQEKNGHNQESCPRQQREERAGRGLTAVFICSPGASSHLPQLYQTQWSSAPQGNLPPLPALSQLNRKG